MKLRWKPRRDADGRFASGRADRNPTVTGTLAAQTPPAVDPVDRTAPVEDLADDELFRVDAADVAARLARLRDTGGPQAAMERLEGELRERGEHDTADAVLAGRAPASATVDPHSGPDAARLAVAVDAIDSLDDLDP